MALCVTIMHTVNGDIMNAVTETFKLFKLEAMANDIIHKIAMLKECELDNDANIDHIIDSLTLSINLIETEIDQIGARK